MLQQQKMMIESTNFDAGVINSVKAGKDVMKEMNKNGVKIEGAKEQKNEKKIYLLIMFLDLHHLYPQPRHTASNPRYIHPHPAHAVAGPREPK